MSKDVSIKYRYTVQYNWTVARWFPTQTNTDGKPCTAADACPSAGKSEIELICDEVATSKISDIIHAIMINDHGPLGIHNRMGTTWSFRINSIVYQGEVRVTPDTTQTANECTWQHHEPTEDCMICRECGKCESVDGDRSMCPACNVKAVKQALGHETDEDCMNCRECGESTESLNDDNVCPNCVIRFGDGDVENATSGGRGLMTGWVHEALLSMNKHRGTIFSVCKHVWEHHSQDIRSTRMIYDWQYEIRWSTDSLRRRGIIQPAGETPRGVWALADIVSET